MPEPIPKPPPISPRVWAVTGIPLVSLVLASGLLLFQVLSLEHAARSLARAETGLVLCLETERDLRAEEATRLRRWLVGAEDGDAVAAAADVALSFRDLRGHFKDDAVQLDRISTIEAGHRTWQRFADGLEVTGDQRFEGNVQASKQLLDKTLTTLDVLENDLRRLRGTRAEELTSILTLLTYAALPILLMLALAMGINGRREVFRLARDFNDAMAGRQLANRELALQAWVREQLRVLGVPREDAGFRSLGERALESLIAATRAVVGSIYVVGEDGLERCAARGVAGKAPSRVPFGHGLLGEAAKTGKLEYLDALPADYLNVESSLGSTSTTHLALVPCTYKGEVNAVIELGFLEPPSERCKTLLEQTGAALGMSFAVTSKKVRLQNLLSESRQQAEALQLRQAELRVANEELSLQSEELRVAQAQLEARQAELERSNIELTTQRNALDETRKQLETRALQLRRAGRYKSEFLASMSHELRTPLNSILILSKSISQGDPSRLTPEQIKYAETIHASGKDLLALINDVLELSKIEAGAVELNLTPTTVSDVVRPVLRITEPLARDRGLELKVELEEPNLPFTTDVRRVQQILKNLLSNACKFTGHGSVTLSTRREGEGLEFSVRDTGPGIASEHHETIFEAFRQVDGSANRRFGGTGLGLSISRDLARNLGGEVTVSSQVAEGSCFTLSLPLAPRERERPSADPTRAPLPAPANYPASDPDNADAPPSASESSPAERKSLPPGVLNYMKKRVQTETPRDEKSGRSSQVPIRARPGKPQLTGRRVMLLEEDVRNVFVLSNALEAHGAELTVARTAEEALQLLEDGADIELILLDLKTPEIDALDTARRIRTLAGSVGRLPIIALASGASTREASIAAGADDYVAHPVEVDKLVSLMRVWLSPRPGEPGTLGARP
jgi:signal transduction histidine kinase